MRSGSARAGRCAGGRIGVAGVGAGQSILAFLDRKRADIAILKALGADGGFVFLTFFLQVMAVALAATVLGAALGAALPFAVVWIYGEALPVPPTFGLYPMPIVLSLTFGLLSAVAFSVPPLARARDVPPETYAPRVAWQTTVHVRANVNERSRALLDSSHIVLVCRLGEDAAGAVSAGLGLGDGGEQTVLGLADHEVLVIAERRAHRVTVTPTPTERRMI